MSKTKPQWASTRETPGLANVRILGQTVHRRLRESGLRARRTVVGPILKQRHIIAMDVIVCTAGVGNVLRTSVCTSPTVLESEVLIWPGICHDGRTQGTVDAIQYRDDILDPIVLSFLQRRNFDHVFQHDNARCHVARVCQDFLNQNHIPVLPWPTLSPDLSPIALHIYGMNSVDVFTTVKIPRKYYRSCAIPLI